MHEAGITTVEALADMTPEQLEELPGVGPKTVEKISIAVNNYFLTLDGQPTAEVPSDTDAASGETTGEAAAAAEGEPAVEAAETESAEAVTASPEHSGEKDS
jgi:N utilization substance protein A